MQILSTLHNCFRNHYAKKLFLISTSYKTFFSVHIMFSDIHAIHPLLFRSNSLQANKTAHVHYVILGIDDVDDVCYRAGTLFMLGVPPGSVVLPIEMLLKSNLKG